MKLITKRNTTAFTTRSLVRVVRRAFDRVGIRGPITLKFGGGAYGVSYENGEVVDASVFGAGRAVVREGRWARFYVPEGRTALDLCTLARWAGYAMRGVKGKERGQKCRATDADKEFLADKPLVLKKVPPRKRGAEGPADKLAKRLARCAAYAKRARERMKRAQAALKRLEKKQRRLEKLLKKHEGEQGT